MGLSLKPEHLKRYKDIAWLFMKYGRSELVHGAGLEDALEPPEPDALTPHDSELPEKLAADLEKLGPTYIKLGQLLSTRPDILPAAFLEALAKLQDSVEPFSFAEVERTVTSELGVRISKAFSRFDAAPIGAASLGQVHRAALRDGRDVAVKVQRPGIRETILTDLEALGEIAAFADAHTETGRRIGFGDLVEQFRKSVLRELDYRQEAQNLLTLAKNLEEFDRIFVPLPVDDYTSARVLTLEFVRGQKVTSLNRVVQTDLDGSELADQLFRAYLKQILVDGFFHADPHPGNVFLTEDNRIALLDLGMIARVAPSMQENLLRVLLAVSEGRGDEAARTGMEIGRPMTDFDETAFRRQVADLVGQSQNMRIEQMSVGRTILAFSRVCVQSGMRVPPELAMLGKTLLNLDQISKWLDPGFDPNAALRRHAAEITQRRMMKSMSPAHIFEALIELRGLAQKLPSRFGTILDLVAKNELRVKVDALDEKLLMEGFQKVANRITLGLVLAALIVGAAMLMRVETSFRLLGYPGLAILSFLAASAGGLFLILNITLSDRMRKRPNRPQDRS